MPNTITITLPEGWTAFQVAIREESAPELVSALCAQYGYATHIANEEGVEVVNPETPHEFANRMVREKYLTPVIVSYRAKQAAAQPPPDMQSVEGLSA